MAMLEIVDWNALAAAGLVREINEKVLHPLGLSMIYSPSEGVSQGAYLAPDHIFTYSDENPSPVVSYGRA